MSSDSSLEHRQQQNLSEILVPDTEMEDSNGHDREFSDVSSRPYMTASSGFTNVGETTFVPCTQDVYDNNFESTAGTSEMDGANANFTARKLFGASAPSTNGTSKLSPVDQPGEWRPMQSVQSASESVPPPVIQIESSSSAASDPTAGSSSSDWHLHLESDSQATQPPEHSKPIEGEQNLVGYDVEDVSPPPSNENVQDEEAGSNEPKPTENQSSSVVLLEENETKPTEEEEEEKNSANDVSPDKPETSHAQKMDVDESKQPRKKRPRKDDFSAISASDDSGDDLDEEDTDKLEVKQNQIAVEASPSRGGAGGRGRGRGRGRGAGRGRGRGGRGRGSSFTAKMDSDNAESIDRKSESDLTTGAPDSDQYSTPIKVNIGPDESSQEEPLTPASTPAKRGGRPKRGSSLKATPQSELRKSLRSQTPRSTEDVKKRKVTEEESHAMSDEEEQEEAAVVEEQPQPVVEKKPGRRGRPKRVHATPAAAEDEETKKRRRTSSAHSTDNESGESRQLRKRAPMSPPQSTPKSTAPATKTPKSTAKSATKSTKPKPTPPPPPPTTTPSGGDKKHKRGGKQTTKTVGKSPSAPADPYDFESNVDMTPLPPLKHLHVARSTFGEVKFTKSPTSDKKTKYVNTSKNADIRYQRANADTQRSIHQKTTKILSPSLRKQISPNKSSLSSGDLADISSYESKLTSDISNPKSSKSSLSTKSQSKTKSRVSFEKDMTDDSYTAIKKTGSPGRRSSTGSSGRGGGAGSYSLFSDVEQKISDNFDDENFLSPSHKADNRRRKPVLPHGEDSEDDDLREIEAMDEDEHEEEEEEEEEEDRNFEDQTKPRKRAAVKTKRSRSSTDGTEPSTPAPSKKRRKRTNDRSSLTPKPREPHLESKSPDEQLAADFPSQNSTSLLPGARVLAKWKDRNFYPGNIVVNLGLGRYKVRFLDCAYRDMPAPDIVPVARLKVGDVLMVKTVVGEDEEVELQPVTILATPPSNDSQEWYDGIFQVKNTSSDKTEKVPWEKMVIDVDQTKAYVRTRVNIYAQNIVADNISDSRARRTRGVRSTSPSTSVDGTTTADNDTAGTPHSPSQYKQRAPRGGRGGTPRGRGRGRGSASSRNSANASPASGANSPRFTADSPRTPRGGGRGRGRGRGGRGRGAYENLDISNRTPVSLSPYRHSGTVTVTRREPLDQLFEGLKFVLTSANRAKPKDSSFSDASEEEKPTVQFNKKQVRQMIDERGGNVVEDFSMLADVSNNCYLIADQHYRTHKYLSALARAVPCVSHVWIHDSCQKNKLLPFKNYVLPAGQSLETNQIVEWHDQCPKLLEGLTVFVYTENRPQNPTALDFVQIWSPLVSSMGATVVSQMPEGEDAELDLLLTDVSCPSNVLQSAAEIGANAVSSEWLIQAIITGSKPEPDGHPKYRYDYVEQGGGTE